MQNMSTKKTLLLLPVLCLLLSGCTRDIESDPTMEDAKASAKIQEEPVTIHFSEPDLFPEGIAYDPFRHWFYVSSVTRGDIGIVTMDGTYNPFITDPTLTGTAGLELDKARKRLLVSNAEGGIGAYDLATGTRIFYTDLSAVLPGADIFINDIVVDPQGNAYVTNSFSPVIYKVDPYGNATIFFEEEDFATGPGEFGFNGITYYQRGYLLVAFNLSNQIVRIPVRDPESYSIVQLDAPLKGPDGLLLSKDGKTLIIGNNAADSDLNGQVLTFATSDAWVSGTLVSAFETGPVFPTTLTSDGQHVYVLYAYLHELLSGGSWSTFTIQEVPQEIRRPF